MNISTQKMKATKLTVAFILFFFNVSFSQTLELEKIAQYSLLSGEHAVTALGPKKVLFDSESDIFFNLGYVNPGTSNGLVFGSIVADEFLLFDTADVVGFPDQLINILVDEDDNCHYSTVGPFGGRIIKANKAGVIFWECFASNNKPFNPVFHIISEDNHPVVLLDENFLDTTERRLVKINNTTGEKLWESENIFETTGVMSAHFLKEVNGRFQLFQNSDDSMNIMQFDQDGNIVESNNKVLSGNSFPNEYINMDEEGNTYLGFEGWGYKCPKLNQHGDTLWFYERPSPFGIETTNRTLDILFDSQHSTYISGPYRFEEEGLFSMLLTKLNSDGEVIWETSTHYLSDSATIFPNKTFINKDTIWSTVELFYGPGNAKGAIIAFDVEGNVLLFKEIEEFSPIGRSAWMDFHEDEIAIIGSSSAEIDTDSIYQHIIRYKVSTITNVSTPEVQTVKIIPYPNPSSDWVSFKNLNAAELDFIKISDMQGRVVSFLEKEDIEDVINILYLAAGTYIINYGVAGKQYAAKIVKQ